MTRRIDTLLALAAILPGCSEETAPHTHVEVGAPEPITFADLSLEGLDRDRLIEGYSGATIAEDALELPEAIRRLDGRLVRLRGYVIPHLMEGTEVTEFMLVRDLGDCCFGGSPGPDEWIAVKMVEGRSASYGRFTPTLVTGTLLVGGDRGELRWTPGIFRMAGTQAEFDL